MNYVNAYFLCTCICFYVMHKVAQTMTLLFTVSLTYMCDIVYKNGHVWKLYSNFVLH